MEKIHQQIGVFADILTGKIQTQTKRVIALISALLVVILGVFGNFISLTSEVREGLSYLSAYLPTEVTKIIGNGHLSLFKIMRFSFEMDSPADGFIILAFMTAFVVLGFIAIIGILSGKKNSTFGLAIIPVVSFVCSIFITAEYNKTLKSYIGSLGGDVKLCQFSSQLILIIALGFIAHLCWVACHSDLSKSGELANLGTAKEEFSMMFNKAKTEATKAAELAVEKAKQAKEDNSCKSCGKLVSPTSKFCSSCGAQKEDKPVVVIEEAKAEKIEETTAE